MCGLVGSGQQNGLAKWFAGTISVARLIRFGMCQLCVWAYVRVDKLAKRLANLKGFKEW